MLRSMLAIPTLALMVFLPASLCEAGQLLLTENGQPRATIVVDDSLQMVAGSRSTKIGTVMIAAEELQKYLEKASGAQLPIVTVADAPADGTLILVGRSALSEQHELTPPTESEGLLIKSFPRGLAIIGEVAAPGTNNRSFELDRGTHNAVYIFLERFLDFRFYFGHEIYTPDSPKNEEWRAVTELGTCIPQAPTLAVATPLEYRDAPVFPHRQNGWAWHYGFKPAMLSGRANMFMVSHTQHGTSWPRRFQDTHPEYFLLKQDGTRDFKRLCYSEPGVLAEYLADWEHYFATGQWRGDWEPPTEKYVYLEPNDNYGDCACDRCQALMRRGNILQRHSDLWWDFVRRAALEVKQRWPDKRVATLAYARHYYPPGFDLPDNVDVMMATHWPRQYVGKQPRAHQKNLDMLKQWSAKVGNDRSRLYIFDYYCYQDQATAAPVIFPYYKQRWLQETRDLISGEYNCTGGNALSRDHFMISVWMKLLWNPDLDIDAYLADYCEHFFGPAAQPMTDFYRLLIDRYENVVWPDLADHDYTPVHIYGQTYTPEVIAHLESYLLQAQAAVSLPPRRSWELRPDAAWIVRNPTNQQHSYRITLSPTAGVWLNPQVQCRDRSLTYRGELAQGMKLVASADGQATLYSPDVPDSEDVSDRVTTWLPVLAANASELCYFYCDAAPEEGTMQVRLGDAPAASDSPDENLYRRRVQWMTDSFEIFDPSSSVYQGISAFLVLARTAHKWLDHVPTYTVLPVAGAPSFDLNDLAWQQAEETYLIRGSLKGRLPPDNFGFPADVPTRIKMLHDSANVYLAFLCTEAGTISDEDSVAVSLFKGAEPAVAVTCRPDGTAETQTPGVSVQTVLGSGWWAAFLTIPKTAIEPSGNLGTYRADLLRTRGDRSYLWAPRLGSPWGGTLPPAMSRRGKIVFGQ